jgi:transposase InsO family protein
MDSLNLDFAQLGQKNYLVGVDRATGMTFVEVTRDKTTQTACNFVTKLGNLYGVPKEIRSDSGPAFRKSFCDWLDSIGCDHSISSAYHPQGNGLAERKIQDLKGYLSKLGPISGAKLDEVVLEMNRNVSQVPGVGTAIQRFLGWTPRIPGIPSLQEPLSPIQQSALIKARQNLQEKTAKARGRANRDEVIIGDKVRVQNMQTGAWSIIGSVVSLRICEDGQSRSAIVQTHDGQALTRNLKYIRLYSGPDSDE